jgi:hypothetical protein
MLKQRLLNTVLIISIFSCNKKEDIVVTHDKGKTWAYVGTSISRTPQNFGTLDVLAGQLSHTTNTPPQNLMANQAATDGLKNYYVNSDYGVPDGEKYLLRINLTTGTGDSFLFPVYGHAVIYCSPNQKLYAYRDSICFGFTINEALKTVEVTETYNFPTRSGNTSTSHGTKTWLYSAYRGNIYKVDVTANNMKHIYSDAGGNIKGIRYNPNDDKIYGVKSVHGNDSLFSFNTTNDTYTPLMPLTYPTNGDMYSATIDPCKNEYIITQNKQIGIGSNIITIVNLSSLTETFTEESPNIVQGLLWINE